MKTLVTTLALLVWTTSFAQNCFCDKDSLLSEIISCDTIKFDNRAKLYWNFNCDSSWLTFESPTRQKDTIFSLGGAFTPLTGRLGFIYAQEYRYKFLIQNNVISGCCDPPEFFLFDKTSGQIKDSLGRIIFYSDNKRLPFIIGLTGSNYDTTSNDNYDSLTVYNVDNQKKYLVKLSKGEIKKALKATEEMFPEHLFDEPILKGTTVYLTYLLDKPKSEKKRHTRTIIIDLKKYSR